jgi:hypothetical protein
MKSARYSSFRFNFLINISGSGLNLVTVPGIRNLHRLIICSTFAYIKNIYYVEIQANN